MAIVLRGLAWILVAIVPAWAILVVPADLQASRFLYLAGTGWALAIVVAASSVAATSPRASAAVQLAVVALVALGTSAARIHLRHWQDAAMLRDFVLSVAVADPRIRACPDVAISNAPDNVRGAYVFRNGLPEALAGRGVAMVDTPQQAGCTFEWRALDGAFAPIGSVPLR